MVSGFLPQVVTELVFPHYEWLCYNISNLLCVVKPYSSDGDITYSKKELEIILVGLPLSFIGEPAKRVRHSQG